MNILLTGYTGNLGLEIARKLADHQIFALVRDPAKAPVLPNVVAMQGTLEQLPLCPQIDSIIHSAANTAFRAPLADLRRVNVDGTNALMEFARGCPNLKRFIHISTTCVAGDREGVIEESPIEPPPVFINAYEQTKWEAEALLLGSPLPVEIIRLAIVAGSEKSGAVNRPGALHHTLHWLYNGLIPMIPGSPDSRVDLISTEFAAEAIAALIAAPPKPQGIVHVTSGPSAPRLDELIDHLASVFARTHRGWANRSVAKAEIVDAGTFALFEATVRHSGDALFNRVCEDARSFFPGLLHPRTCKSSSAAAPLVDWRLLSECVFTWLLTHDWGRQSSSSHAH